MKKKRFYEAKYDFYNINERLRSAPFPCGIGETPELEAQLFTGPWP